MSENNILNKKNKSSAKAIGVKSVLNIDSKTRVVTSFGKGNEAVLEKKIVDNTIANEYKGNLTLNVQKPKYEFKNTRRKADNFVGYTDNTDEYTGMDRLGLKPVFEKMIFDADNGYQDNIRVQIAYAVFDIVKALANHSNNITYVINHLQRNNTDNDIVGNVINYTADYNNFKGEKKQQYEYFYKKANSNFVYYDSILTKKQSDTKLPKTSVSEEEAYAVFAVLSFLRNNISHFTSVENNKFDIFRSSYADQKLDFVRKTINDFFDSRLKEVDIKFIMNEKVNFTIALKSLGLIEETDSHKRISDILYNLSVEKRTVKMLGYSLKKLRECAIDKGYISFGDHTEQEISSVRSKIYKLIDLVVIYKLQINSEFKEKINCIIDELRFSRSEQEKEKIYHKYSELLFKDSDVKKTVNNVVYNVFDYCKNSDNYKGNYLKYEYILGKKSAEKYHDFTKLILFICNFLDGKEINDLLTRLINRFQVINSFNDTVKALKKDGVDSHKYNEHYGLFNKSNVVANELFLVKSIASMSHKFEDVKMASMYKDALLALGVPNERLDDVFMQYLSKDSKTRVSSYIANNVINSKRFKYVIKYISPACVYQIASNETIVGFVLDQLPKKQLDKYYQSVIGKDIAKKETEISEIKNLITNTSFENNFARFTNLGKGKKLSPKENVEREKGKALLRLYFTIVYLVVKNLVNCNSLYTIAFFYLERDCKLFSEKMGENDPSATAKPLKNFDTHYDILTRMFMYDKSLKHKDKDVKKLSRYIVFNDDADIRKEIKNFPYGINSKRNHLYRTYRNTVMHLNAVSQMGEYLKGVKKLGSYFELYHYIVQNAVIDSLDSLMKTKTESGKTKGIEDIENCYNYAKDLFDNNNSPKIYSQTLLRSMNIPLGYTLPRYKNLSYEKFFDRQRLEEKQKQIEREKLNK